MHIFNVRFGFATNSSSSHSVVMIPNKSTLPNNPENGNGEFGWEWFFLTELEDKLRYLAVQNQGNFPKNVMEALFGHDGSGYIDHDSYGTVDSSKDITEIMEEIERISNPKLAILGGNDNSDVPDKYSHLKPFPDLKNSKIKHDGEVQVIYDPEDGTKIRFSMNPEITEYTRSSTPELVDLKITDYCAMGCDYCYQGSTKEGLHASLDDIKMIIDDFAEKQVFEVALGGGETTDHPDFLEIVEYIASKGITPNFTTRNTKWAKDPETAKRFYDAIGKFAVSVDSKEQLEKYYNTFKEMKNLGRWSYDTMASKMNAQIVMGTFTEQEFRDIVYFCSENNITLTLLGYKTTGRGNEVKPMDYSWWLDIVTEAIEDYDDWDEGFSVGVDTEIIRLFREDLVDKKVPELFFTSIEGAFSCYVDAVEMTIARSSYEPDPSLYTPYTSDSWLNVYQNFELTETIPVLVD